MLVFKFQRKLYDERFTFSKPPDLEPDHIHTALSLQAGNGYPSPQVNDEISVRLRCDTLIDIVVGTGWLPSPRACDACERRPRSKIPRKVRHANFI
jgi:hypothetical protein